MSPDGLLYQNGDWGIYTGFSVGLDQYLSDVVHECSIGPVITYQIIGNPKCPGCNETQPDDIQTLWQLHNMDKPTLVWGQGPLQWAKTSQQKLNKIQTKMIKK